MSTVGDLIDSIVELETKELKAEIARLKAELDQLMICILINRVHGRLLQILWRCLE